MGALDLIGMSTDGIHEVGVMAGRGRDLIAHLATIAAVVLQSRKQFDAKNGVIAVYPAVRLVESMRILLRKALFVGVCFPMFFPSVGDC